VTIGLQMEVHMKMILATLVGACLLAAPIAFSTTAAQAQSRGGGSHGGGFHGGGFGRGGFRGDGLGRGGVGGRDSAADSRRGGFRDQGFRRDRFGEEDLFDFGLAGDFDLGFYGDPAFDGFFDYDYGAPYPEDGGYAPATGPADWTKAAPSWQYQPQPPTDQAASAKGCGAWVWNRDQSSYSWAVC
jgi:hypothetical protein